MKNYLLFVLTVFLSFTACKKEKAKKKEFKGITQTQGGKLSPVFEFSSGTNPANIIYNAVVPYVTGTVLVKINYKLTYKEQRLTNALIETGGESIPVTYSINAKNLIIGSDFHGKRNNVSYSYDSQNRLTSSAGAGFRYEYSYDEQNLSKIVATNQQGLKFLEVVIEADRSSNPLLNTPLPYLEEDMPMWTWFSLSKYNITGLTYTYFGPSGQVTETSKYVFSYTYEDDRPITMKRYLYAEFLKGEKGYYDGFTYNY
ncbi:MAG: hypothetical protein EOP48_02720 [Sphingobacteriales bacterium]|nr:MAG: hypothetical protein EOP48_02720 [Sphingobacteriales bacterium]